MSERLVRHFTMLCIPPPSEIALRTIFSAILGGFLDSFFTAGRHLLQSSHMGAAVHVRRMALVYKPDSWWLGSSWCEIFINSVRLPDIAACRCEGAHAAAYG
jgi:hypothetical protein